MQTTLSISRAGETIRDIVVEDGLLIGRAPSCQLLLEDESVSKRHARIEGEGGVFFLVDEGSTNGVWLGGERIAQPLRLVAGLCLSIGPYELQVSCSQGGEGADLGSAGQEPPPADLRAFLREAHEQVIARMDLRRLEPAAASEGELRRRAELAIHELLLAREAAGELPAGFSREGLERALANEVLGLGPLEALLADEEISEIMVNGADRIYVERRGQLSLSTQRFSSEQAMRSVIDRIVAPLGRRVDESSPMVDARLPDGARVHVLLRPLSLIGPCITIRKFRREALGIDELVGLGGLSEAMARFLALAVSSRQNILISGGTGSGKTTLLNVLTDFIGEGERIITVEDAAELQLRKAHWLRLESRPANLEGRGEVTIRDLVRGCLRMRPDRIVVGECRGGEALDMLQAMNTGHDGSLTTLHANTPRDALARLETLCLMAGMELPARALRQQIVSAVDLVVQQARFSDGSRKITSITELVGMEGETITLQEIYAFRREGIGADGEVLGMHLSSGFVPRFCERLLEEGGEVDPSLFARG